MQPNSIDTLRAEIKERQRIVFESPASQRERFVTDLDTILRRLRGSGDSSPFLNIPARSSRQPTGLTLTARYQQFAGGEDGLVLYVNESSDEYPIGSFTYRRDSNTTGAPAVTAINFFPDPSTPEELVRVIMSPDSFNQTGDPVYSPLPEIGAAYHLLGPCMDAVTDFANSISSLETT